MENLYEWDSVLDWVSEWRCEKGWEWVYESEREEVRVNEKEGMSEIGWQYEGVKKQGSKEYVSVRERESR